MNTLKAAAEKEFGALRLAQLEGIAAIAAATAALPVAHRAYILATAWHETGPAADKRHMTPRREIWGPTPAQTRYEGNVKSLGNTMRGDGKRFAGRGYVQITGRRNYHKASGIVGRDLVADPDIALDHDVAVQILIDGMTKGWFTGKKLADFTRYEDMRRVVNGTDKADLIAGYARKFETVLRAAPDHIPDTGKKPSVTVETTPAPVPPVVKDSLTPAPPVPRPQPAPAPETPAADPAKSIAGWLIAAAGALIAALAAYVMKG